jgi:hypothetical protein
MTEDDKFRIELHRSDSFYGDPLAADRIEELLELKKELTLQLLATSGQAADALDKLAKAVEGIKAMMEITMYPDEVWDKGNTTLAELEGMK